MQLRIILWLVLLAIVVVFVAQNAQAVEVRLLFWRLAMSQALLLIFVLAAGFSLGWFLHAWLAWKRARFAGHAAASRASERGSDID